MGSGRTFDHAGGAALQCWRQQEVILECLQGYRVIYWTEKEVPGPPG